MEKGAGNKVKTVFEISAGGVLYKYYQNSILVILIAVKNKTVWTLPKGLVEKGEDTKETAVREVQEETGCLGEPITLLDKVHLWFYSGSGENKVRHHKIVYYYLLKYIQGDPHNHDYEVDEAKWFEIDNAINTVTYKKDKEVLQKAKRFIYESTDLHTG